MRVGTWNLERRTGAVAAQQLAVLDRLELDVVVLTEPGPGLLDGSNSVGSPPTRPGSAGPESWVLIRGANRLEPVSPPAYGLMAASAKAEVAGRTVLIMGSVLPWRSAPRHAPDLAKPGESSSQMFERVLSAQVRHLHQIQSAHTGALVIWAGDFNQSLEGPNLTGSARGRDLLEEALESLNLVAWNRAAPHAREGLRAIDLVCGSSDVAVLSLELVPFRRDGRGLSDHAGYVVDIA